MATQQKEFTSYEIVYKAYRRRFYNRINVFKQVRQEVRNGTNSKTEKTRM